MYIFIFRPQHEHTTARELCQTGVCCGSLSSLRLEKYVKIKYHASDIILAILGFVIVSVLYCLRLVANERFA